MKKTGLFYSFNTKKTAQTAKRIIENLGKFMEILEVKSANEDEIKRILNLHDQNIKKSKKKSIKS